MRLRPNEYRILLRETEVTRYEMFPDHFLAMNPGLVEEEIEGIVTTEPAFGLQALWVTKENRDRAERLGYTMVEPTAVLATHLTEVIMNYADELLTREDVQNLIETVKSTAKTVVEELIPNILTLGEVQKVLHNLLRERVSIRNLEAILEVLADYAPRTKDTDLLTEYVRHALSRQVCSEYKDDDGNLRVVVLAPTLEKEILDAVQQSDTGEYVPIDPARIDTISKATAESVQTLVQAGHDAIVVTTAQVRRYFRQLVERQVPKLVVLSYNEVDPSLHLESVGQIDA